MPDQDWTRQSVAPGSLGALATGRLLPRADPNAPPLPPGEKRRPLGKDPVSDFVEFLKGIAFSNEQDSSMAQHSGAMLGAALPFAAPAIKLGRAGLAAGEEAAAGLKGIRAFHVSPHDFDRFDLTKIGTGEGAQAYGAGHYFAQDPAVRDSYHQAFTERAAGGDQLVEGGGRLPAWAARRLHPDVTGGPGTPAHAQALDDLINDFHSRIGLMRDSVARRGTQWWLDEARIPVLQDTLLGLEDLQRGAKFKPPPPVRTYEASLNVDPARLIDWDRNLVDQPHVVEALRGMGFNNAPWPYTRKLMHPAPGVPFVSLTEGGGQEALKGAEEMMRYAGGPSPTSTRLDVRASQALDERGIPGVRYADGFSRTATGATPRTHNYVIFNDNKIDILRKWGLLPPLAAGALGSRALAGLGQQNAQEQVGTPPPVPAPVPGQ